MLREQNRDSGFWVKNLCKAQPLMVIRKTHSEEQFVRPRKGLPPAETRLDMQRVQAVSPTTFHRITYLGAINLKAYYLCLLSMLIIYAYCQ